MKKWLLCALTGSALILSSVTFAVEPAANGLKIGVIDFRACVENSKMGKREQASFEAMKNQMEKVVEEKEKVLTELAGKLNNEDELELMSPEAETELKRKFRALSQEMNQIQTQCYQTLNQANIQVVQKLSDIVTLAAEKVAKEQNLALVLNSEGTFYFSKLLDISDFIVKQMDAQFDEEAAKPHTVK